MGLGRERRAASGSGGQGDPQTTIQKYMHQNTQTARARGAVLRSHWSIGHKCKVVNDTATRPLQLLYYSIHSMHGSDTMVPTKRTKLAGELRSDKE